MTFKMPSEQADTNTDRNWFKSCSVTHTDFWHLYKIEAFRGGRTRSEKAVAMVFLHLWYLLPRILHKLYWWLGEVLQSFGLHKRRHVVTAGCFCTHKSTATHTFLSSTFAYITSTFPLQENSSSDNLTSALIGLSLALVNSWFLSDKRTWRII